MLCKQDFKRGGGGGKDACFVCPNYFLGLQTNWRAKRALSVRWIENFTLPCLAMCYIYIYAVRS